MKVTTAIALTLFAVILRGETYRGIGPLDRLRDVKALFPNAKFELLKAAWAQETDTLYVLTGPGIDGNIVVAFHDPRPTYRHRLETEKDASVRATLREIVNHPAEDELTVRWIRWVPPEPIPLERFVAKYGHPDRTGFRDDNMRPFQSWTVTGVTVTLDDASSKVTNVEFTFTTADERSAWKTKFGWAPDSLKEE
jgi:hypothetical protein